MNQSENKNPNLTKPALFRAPQGLGFERLVAYLGAVHAVGPADGRVYVYQDMTEDDSGPYWMVRLTRTEAALRRYQAGEYLQQSDYGFPDVTPEDAAEVSDRHLEIIAEILECRGIKM